MISSPQPVAYTVYQTKTVFMPLRYLFPECLFLLRETPQINPLHCLTTDYCPKNAGCGEALARRVHFFFTNVETSAELIIAYFKVGASIKAGIFFKDLRTPRVTTLNPFAFKKLTKEAVVSYWTPTADFCKLDTTTIPTIIPASSLIR